MGHVAISAGYYLLAKLGMHEFAEFSANGLFDIDHVEVKQGRVQPVQRPRNRCFIWKAPNNKRDIIVFIGESQPPLGKYVFCEQLIDFAREMNVQRVFTFAAMATGMRPEHDARVYAAATDDEALKELDRPDLYLLDEGRIGGLNGVLIGAAADKGMQGICLLGEMPHVFAQFPFPKASIAVLRIFAEMAALHLDFTEIENQAEATEKQLTELITRLEQRLDSGSSTDPSDEFRPAEPEQKTSEEDIQRIEELFQQSSQDRSKAYELKRELDRLGVFEEHEDRFLDLFKKME